MGLTIIAAKPGCVKCVCLPPAETRATVADGMVVRRDHGGVVPLPGASSVAFEGAPSVSAAGEATSHGRGAFSHA